MNSDKEHKGYRFIILPKYIHTNSLSLNIDSLKYIGKRTWIITPQKQNLVNIHEKDRQRQTTPTSHISMILHKTLGTPDLIHTSSHLCRLKKILKVNE